MKIALIGYGKMGKAIEEIAVERGHEILLKIDSHNQDDFNEENLEKIDVAIEFTNPEQAFNNIKKCLLARKAVVCGSTGWLAQKEEINTLCNSVKGSFIHANNFSIGVNLFFEINAVLAGYMANHSNYHASIQEIHHTEKKDAPSGTAIHLANDILNKISAYQKWVSGVAHTDSELSIESKRIDPAPGTHTVCYASEIDTIEITHTAHNRKGFALGAVLAAEFIYNKTGVFTMKDVLSL